MLQRQQTELMYHHNFQLKLEQSQQQLSADFYQLTQLKQEIKKNRISQSQCSNILQQMIQKMSHPILGIQILKDKFQQMDLIENTGFQSFQTIQAKASAIYVQVIMGDLKKMLNQQPIEPYSTQQVKNVIQEINWKLGMEKSIHQSRVQQVGQHVQLMKFFQGVRNYQNWNEKVKKQTIQKLKQKAHMIQLKLTLKKGFILSKIQKITQSYEQFYQKLFINKCRNIAKVHNIPKCCSFIQNNNVKLAFTKIYQSSIQLKDSQKLGYLFDNYWSTKVVSNVQKELLMFLKRIFRNKLFACKLEKLLKAKKFTVYAKLLQKINFKRKVQNSSICLGLQKLSLINQRKSKILAIKALNIPLVRVFKLLNKSVTFVLSQYFRAIKQESDSNIKRPSQLSLKLRGMILSSLPAPQNKPIDIRKTFLDWYIKGNETKFTKQIYNIWLTGTTSKFTFFMRLKNLIDQNRNYKIKYELKLFLMVFNQKMNKYYNHGQKSIVQKWLQNTRRIKKIQKTFSMLSNISKENDQVMKKNSLHKITHAYQQSIIKQKYCFKYMNNYIGRVQSLINTWKMLPDIKRSKGQTLMRNILRRVIQQIIHTKTQALSVFKQNKNHGRNKKVLMLRRAFNQDFIYLQKFFQMWRMKKNDLIKKQDDLEDKKERTLIFLQKFHKSQNKKNIGQIIKKFSVRKAQQKKKQVQTKKIFINILQRNQRQNMISILIIFKGFWKQGNMKKNNLVKSLVQANKKKQTGALYLIKNKAQQLHNLQKIKRTQELFFTSELIFSKAFTIFDKSQYIFGFLCRILTNRARNNQLALKNIQALPNRMNWKKRDNGIKLYETLQHFYKKNKGFTFAKYKQSLMIGRFKMTKSMDIMAAKYFDVTRKYFNTYRKNINRIKMDQLNKVIGGNFEHLNQVFIGNMKTLFIGEAQWKKKADHIVKLNQRVKARIGQTFKLWRETSKAMVYYESVLKQKKTRYIQILLKAVSKNQLTQTKKSISMFKKNAHINQIQLTFLKKLCETQAGKVVKAMMIWKNLPQPKNKQLIGKATKFESIMAKIGMKNFRKTFLAFKDGQYYGNQKKKYCIRQLVAKSNSGIKSYFEKWRGNSKLSIIFGQCEGVSHFIHIGQNLLEHNFRLLFEGNEAQLKRQKLHRLDLILCQQKKEVLSLWRQKSISMRRSCKKKTILLTKLIQIQQKTQNKNIRDFVMKKYSQLRIQHIMQKQKVKESKILLIIDNAMKKRKENIAQSFEVFRFNLYKGNFKKKKAFENWLRDKIANIHGILGGWNDLSKQAVLSDKRSIVSHNFEQMEIIVRANLSQIISNRRQMEIKKKALNTLFKNQQQKLKGCIYMWHNQAKRLKIEQEFNREMDKKTKTSILQRINLIVSNGSDQNVKKAIQKFKTSMKVQAIQKKFINQLLKTKSGKCLQGFKKWKSIPAINLGQRYKKGQKFFNKIEALHKSHVKFVYSTFKTQYEEGNMMKKQSILQLFDMTSTGIRRYYRRWQKMTKQKHTLSSVTQLMKSLDIMNDCMSNQYMIMFQDQRAYKIKISAINKLIAAAEGTTKNYFNKWRDNAKQLKIQQSMDSQKKTLALDMFTRAIQGSQKNLILDTIRKFKQNSIITDISKKFFNRLLQTKTGKLIQLFEKLKTIPDTKIGAKKKKAIKFQFALNRFAMKVIRATFTPFKNCNYIAGDRKKYCLTKLVRNSMGQQLKSFSRWRNVTYEAKILTHSEIGQKCFQNMQNLFSNSISSMFTDYKIEVEKKKGLCRKLVMNSQFVQHHAFMIWKQAQREDDLKIVKKQSKVRDVLKNLLNIYNGHEKKSAVSGFGQFRNFLVLDKIQSLSKKQKNAHTKAYKFYQALQRFKNNRLCLLINSCKNSAIQMNFANKIASLQTVFKHSTQIYAQNLMMVMRSQKQNIIIENALNRIFNNFKVGTQKAFNIWRQSTKVMKLEKLMGNEKKKNILDIMNKLINNSQSASVKKSIQLFKKNCKQIKIQRDILMKILNCKAGQVPILFMKWKALPSQTGKKYKMKAMKFENTLFRAWNQRMKFVYQGFKNQSYDATVKKQYAIRKLIATCQSDSTRILNRWRKINNETTITQKMLNLDKVFSTTQDCFIKNIEIFNYFKAEQNAKANALSKIFMIQESHLKDSLNRWIEQNRRYKIQKITQSLTKYTQEQLNKRFIKQGFNQIKQRFELQTMKGYINSLWKWKMTNTQNQYYQKFIKVFSQSEQLLSISKLLNKKQSDTLHFAFGQIKMSSKQRFDRKGYLIQKYLLKRVKYYFDKMRSNAYKQKLQTFKTMYSQVVKIQSFTNIISKIVRKQQNDVINILKLNQKYIQKVQKFNAIISTYKTKNNQEVIKNIYKYGFYKLIKLSLDLRTKVIQHFKIQAFQSISETAKLRHFDKKISNATVSSTVRKSFQTLRKNSQRLAKQKLVILLLSGQLQKKWHQSKVKAIQSFQRRKIKYICLNKMSQTLTHRIQYLQRQFFQIDQNDVKVINLLQKFKRGTAIKNIIQKQDKNLLKGYFERLKKKENKWISESIRRFATRSTIRSSVSISLWRLKTYAQH